jgi:preprotein translocase SecE subunit
LTVQARGDNITSGPKGLLKMGFIGFIKDVRTELGHVSWPTRAQVIKATALVIVLSLVTAALLGAFDQLFSRILKVFL